MPRRSEWYEQGYSDGQDAAIENMMEAPREMAEAARRDRLGEIVGEILSNWSQMADTIYYYGTSRQIGQWEEGFSDGFDTQIKFMLKERREKRIRRKFARVADRNPVRNPSGLPFLKREASKIAKWRGHRMSAWKNLQPTVAMSHCIRCRAWVRVTTKPDPNDINIGGPAVAEYCK